jgi:hypothetical protein
MIFTITINLWWVLVPVLVFLTITFFLALALAFLMCKGESDKWYTFRHIVFSLKGAKAGWYWFSHDILRMHKW